MKSDELLDAIGEAKDEYVHDVRNGKSKKMPGWAKWTSAIAACLVLVIGVNLIFSGMGGNSTGGGGGHDDGYEFMDYAGPMFPLTTLNDANGITATRDITLDFAPWVKTWITNEEQAAEAGEENYQESLEWYNEHYPDGGRYTSSTDILVTDAYTLTNTTTEDVTVSLLYPYVSNLMELDTKSPVLTVDGEAVETELILGPYSGGFQGVLGADDPEGSANLYELTSWEDYQTLMSDGSYLAQALAAPIDLTKTAVIVYEFTDPTGPESSDGIPNPSIRVTFDMDYDQTTVLSYGFHSGSYRPDEGTMGQGFSIPDPDAINYGEPFYLIILGDDVANMDIKGYVTGGWDTEKELEWFDVNVQRYETDLDTILRQCVRYIYDRNNWTYGDTLDVDFETYYALFCDHLAAYGLLAEDGGTDRYDMGWLSEISEVSHVDRVCYLTAEITIPAGESVTLNAAMRKAGSFDYYCAHTEKQGVYGYDMVTQLGSTLTFTQQTAKLEDRGQIEIVGQNFGFDLANGITSVTLDLSQDHYWIEVRKVQTD